MGQYAGLVQLGDTLAFTVAAKTSAGTPTEATSGPTYRCYGASGLMTNGAGTATKKDTGTVTGATNASPIVVTSAGHGLSTGTRVTIAAVAGNTAANGTFPATAIDSSTFSLDGSTGSGAYTSGGTWHATGLYGFALDCTGANGYAAGQTYTVLVTWVISGTTYADTLTFTVV